MNTPLRVPPVLCAVVAASVLWLCGAAAAEEASQHVEAVAEKVEKGGEREKFDQGDLTAAHPTLPLGSEAKVTNLETGESVEVQINDRGPYAKGRDIDLSKAAAKEIGIDKKNGEAPVKIEADVPKKGK